MVIPVEDLAVGVTDPLPENSFRYPGVCRETDEAMPKGGLSLAMLHDRFANLRAAILKIMNSPRDPNAVGTLLRVLQYLAEMNVKRRAVDTRYKRRAIDHRPRKNKLDAQLLETEIDRASLLRARRGRNSSYRFSSW